MEKWIRHKLARCAEDCDLVSSGSEWGMMDCGDMWGPQDAHSSSQVATHSEMVRALVLHTAQCASWILFSFSMCVYVCACAFLCERLACRGGWSGLENILCDSTSGLASLSSDIPLSLPHCNSSTVHSLCFVQVPVSEGDDVTTHELCEFRGLPKGGLERFSVCPKKKWEHKYKYKVLLGL